MNPGPRGRVALVAAATGGLGLATARGFAAAGFGAIAAFLASEQAGFITGTPLKADGGLGQGI
ncbi:hypothetical protein [Actinomadura chokoriensis]|uniref:Short-chain dehydrogenase n=1 Tax=Actinomadura chokoriensis TaxID=454156 RepID=A0ABV4QYP4_9ACTN